ncbi:MAG TPA: LLM class flavin-dependent oxidoreductase [Actinophytocola sp.]|uniref:LLM class flavin-dependent oxidoreductase n=1 Tax=Actinophytocola sp. TaxID=1872138 RepID=UPI002DDD9C9B|nr:LLM class flavin-dependent oxidoreductase [Actinophytocola sp.]HEV2783892.1 LLM class flavin-dependent oxidoreductase [Actinophytocola sp.]
MTPADSGRIRFHWSLPSTGVSDRGKGASARTAINPISDLDRQRDFCRRAEELGIDSLLVPIGFQRAEPACVATAFGLATERIKFMMASRPSVVSPTYFVQQVNTVSAFTNGRVEINVVSGQSSQEQKYYGDFSTHDERYQHADEFWTVCHALWRREFPVNFEGKFIKVEGARVNMDYVSPDSHRPYVYFGGSSDQAREQAIKHADCLLRLAEPPELLAPKIEPALAAGIEVGIICNLIAAETHEDAVEHGYALVENAGEAGKAAVADWRRMLKDSVGFSTMFDLAENGSPWLTPFLWTGLVPYLGPVSMSLIGSAAEIVEAIFEYRRIGVTHFLFQARPDFPTLEFFGTNILPAVNRREAGEPVPG